MRLRAALIGVVRAADASGANAPRTTTPVSATSAAPTLAQPTLTPVRIIESTYGRVLASTAPGAPCTVEVHVGPPQFGDAPPPSVDATADPSGALAVTYTAPALPKQTARYVLIRGSGATAGTAGADFPIVGYPIPATHFTARITVAGVNGVIGGVTARPDPSLSAVRDRDVDRLTRTLVAEWGAATRGLSTVELVTSAPADIVLTVVTARANSFLTRSSADGSTAIFLFPADDGGVLSADNFVAVALHGCCVRPQAADGH